MRQISRLSVTAVSTALLITLSSCSSTQSTLEADDQPSTPTENRETVTSGQISDVPENNNASGESPQGSVTDAANFEITENEDGTVTISRYIGTETDIVIPSQIDGKTVSAIGNVTGTTGAFEGCTNITSVVIPDGVTEIQDNAFYGCTSLETVTIPSGVTLLRNCAFATVQTCVRSTSRAMHRSKPIMYLIPPKMSPCIIRTGPPAGRIHGTDVLRKYISPNKKCKGHAQI